MIDFIQNFLDGIMIGSSYSMLALGFTLIFGVMRRLNLSFGPSVMVGVFAGTFLFFHFGRGAVSVAIATLIGAVIAGIYVERLCFWAIRQKAAVASMVSSFVIWMQLEEIVTIVFPERTYPFPPLTERDPFELGPFFIRAEHLIMFFLSVALMAGLSVLLYRTRFGLAMRAVSQNALGARYMGINIDAMALLTTILATSIGAAAGFLIAATDQQITPLFGLWATFKGLIAMMLGGMGSVLGAIFGGMLLGVVEIQSQWYLGTQYRDLVAYFLLFAFLILRPGGLFGQAIAEQEQAAQQRI